MTAAADVAVGTAGADVAITPALQDDVAALAAWQPSPDLTCRYALGAGAAWSLDGRGIVAPVIAVEEA